MAWAQRRTVTRPRVLVLRSGKLLGRSDRPATMARRRDPRSPPRGSCPIPLSASPDTASVMTIESVLAALRAGARTNRELGDHFERLMRAYLTTDPLYAERFEDVWLWQDWPGRGSQPDTGIDLVAAERAGG